MTAPDPEQLIQRALKAQAGGAARQPTADPDPRTGLTTVQILLIAAITGAVIGMAAGLAILLS